jgi:hypothetical protein
MVRFVRLRSSGRPEIREVREMGNHEAVAPTVRDITEVRPTE